MGRQISRQQMVEVVGNNVESRSRAEGLKGGSKSFADQGNRRRLEIARHLLRGLLARYVPSTQEVVGYFGKGARFAE